MSKETGKAKMQVWVNAVDNKTEDVIELDRAGHELFFETAPGRFPELDPEQVKELSRDNRTRYSSFKVVAEREVREAKHPESKKIPGLEVTGRYSTATQRLHVDEKSKDPNFTYSWPLAEHANLRRNEGWVIADEEELGVFARNPSGIPVVGQYGSPEHVLMKIPKDIADARLRANEQRSKDRVSSSRIRGEEAIRSAGGVPLTDEQLADQGRRNWSEAGEGQAGEG